MSEARPQPYTGLQALQQRTAVTIPRIQPQPAPVQANQVGPAAPPVAPKPRSEEGESLGLIGEETAAPVSESKIRQFAGAGGSVRKEQYRRTPYRDGKGACRMRSFHGRLSQQGLEYMDNQINEWLDNNPEVEVKFVTSQVGVFEGKMREPALILNLWY